MTEPSQEAVEQLIAAIKTAKERFSDIRYDWTDPREDCRGGQEALDRALTLVDSALRAVEQRTRLETLERAAEIIEHFHDLPTAQKYACKPSVNLNDGRDQLRWYANAIRAEIASLQPREACPHGPHVHEVFRSGVKEGEITCDGPREAPKQVPCRSCGGDGWTEAGAVVGARCLSCNGSGREAPKAEEPKR